MLEIIRKHLETSAAVKRELAAHGAGDVLAAARLVASALRGGGKVLFCGNGGSAADSQHIAAELVVRFSAERERAALPAISLTTDTSVLTACGNDYGFDRIFERQVEALGREGDVLVGSSTSGNSKNVILAFEAARRRGMKTVLLSALTGGKLAPLADVRILVPSAKTSHIQESHIAVGHVLCDVVERLLYDDGGRGGSGGSPGAPSASV